MSSSNSSPLTRVSLVGSVVAMATVAVATVAGLAVVPVVGTYLGMLVGGFLAGLTIEDRPVVESGIAAVIAGLFLLMAGPFVGSGVLAAVSALAAVGPLTVLVSLGLSFAVAAFGAHLGDDLRDGLTAPIEPSSGGRTTTPGGVSPLAIEQESPEKTERSTGEPVNASEPDEHTIERESESDMESKVKSEELELERGD